MRSWESIYAQHYSEILKYCGNYSSSKEQAEDLCHDVFIKAYEKLDQFDPSIASIRTWLYRIARNYCLNKIRDTRRHKEIEKFCWSKSFFATTTRLHIVSPSSGPETEIINNDERDIFLNNLGDINAEQRECLILKYYEDMSRNEIANILGIPVATVKSRLYYGLKSLREKLS
ncbi:MAG: RNA polymerase sigma factor [Planctomycetes bacterium]|nr:RNA polymerase sigma factor [Planctomycetota bacterium]